MFTGLITCVGEVVEAEKRSGSIRLGIASGLAAGEMQDGESICVDGVCLTVVCREENRFYADVVKETLERSTLGAVAPGARVNLERALRLGDRLGGHLVQGHVDATMPVREWTRRGDDCRLSVALAPEIDRFIAEKGSVALNGVSLTVAAMHRDRFEVALVPLTLDRTTLGGLRTGDRLNVEVDLMARYLVRFREVVGAGAPAGERPAPDRFEDADE